MLTKLAFFLQNKGIQKLKLSKMSNRKSNIILQENVFRKTSQFLTLENDFENLVTKRQKQAEFCIPNVNTTQPRLCY